MTVQLDVRKPAISVMLLKNIGRSTVSGTAPVATPYTQQSTMIDLTPYLSEAHTVRVRKSIREPAGTFSFAIQDELDKDVMDTFYSVIEPMDVIEIRLSAAGYAPNGGPLPILMRGFVSQVQRIEAMGADGKPTTYVAVSGHDYGKILQIMQIFLMPNAPEDAAAMITSFPFFAKFGDFSNIMQAGAFTQTVFDKVVNPYLANMLLNAASTAAIQLFKTDIQVTGAQVSPFGVGTFNGGNVHALIHSYGDIGPWNEFFVEDREDGVYAVYRPNPFMDPVTHAYLLPGVTPLTPVTIDRTDVLSMAVGRSDANIANYFWVESPRFNLNYDLTSKAMAFQAAATAHDSPIFVTNYGNVSPTLYGTRRMEEQTNQAGLEELNNGNGTQAGAPRNQSMGAALDWMNQRRDELYMQNRDNVILETGSMRLKGNDAIRAGNYLRLAHGNMLSYYYAADVTHDFMPFGNYFTEVDFERGTGFADRLLQTYGQQSPFYSELVYLNQGQS